MEYLDFEPVFESLTNFECDNFLKYRVNKDQNTKEKSHRGLV
jgi:hypothetical protein